MGFEDTSPDKPSFQLVDIRSPINLSNGKGAGKDGHGRDGGFSELVPRIFQRRPFRPPTDTRDIKY